MEVKESKYSPKHRNINVVFKVIFSKNGRYNLNNIVSAYISLDEKEFKYPVRPFDPKFGYQYTLGAYSNFDATVYIIIKDGDSIKVFKQELVVTISDEELRQLQG